MPARAVRSSARLDRHEHALGFRVWRLEGNPMMPEPHTHPDIEVNFLHRGGFAYLHGGAVARVEAQRFTVLWGGVPHQTVAPGITGAGVWLTLPLAWFLQWQLPGDLPERLLGGELVADAPDAADAPRLERWLADFESGDAARLRVLRLELEARFHRLALALPARRRRARAAGARAAGGLGQVERITDYLARHYREPIGVADAAAALRLHPKYLMRLFKRHSRMSVWEYVTRLRLAHAQRLLLTTDLKIVDAALEAGFASLGPFYRAFAAYSPDGRRPLDYRRHATG